MKTLLHIVASPRGDESRTLKVADAFLEGFRHTHPDWQIDTLDLSKEDLPPLTVMRIGGKYVLLGGGELTGEMKESWEEFERHIERFMAADGYLLSTPMWNFGIPYFLKHYIDIIVQPRYLFRYTAEGPEGLVKDKNMVVITSRGGDYGPDSPVAAMDQQEPYLRTVLGFVGLTDILFINAQPMDAMGPEVQEQRIEAAREAARNAGKTF